MTGMLLALDTATDRPTLALGEPVSPGEDLVVASRRDLSREIERLSAALLEQRGVRPADLSGVLVADGPGSFTGLRIGIAFAKGLCRALGVPLLSAPSLMDAAFTAAWGGGVALAEYDALRGDVYRAAYRFSSASVEVLLAPGLAPAGSEVRLPDAFARADQHDASASALIRLAGLAGAVSPVADPAGWEPAYGRPAEAEARYRARQAARDV